MLFSQSESVETTWRFIQPSLVLILGTDDAMEGITPERYMDTYTAIYNYCVSRSRNSNLGSQNASSSNLLVGHELYSTLKDFLGHYVSDLSKFPEETFLQFYVRKWKRFTIGAGYLSNVFDYMNRYWVLKERSDGRRDIFDVETLCLLTWKEKMFHTNKELLVKEILEQINSYRLNRPTDPTLLVNSIKSFVTLGIDTQDLKKINLSLYVTLFETPFMETTAVFYQKESTEYLETHNVIDYMKKAEFRINQEKSFANHYLDERSKFPLLEVVYKALIEDHANLMYEEFDKLLSKFEIADINRMYTLLEKVQSTLDPLARKFEDHVREEGLKSIEALLNSTIRRPKETTKPPPKSRLSVFGVLETDQQKKLYIKSLINTFSTFSDVVEKAFNNDPIFVKALDNACQQFINKNSVATPAGYKGTSKTPEYLAKYSDLLMKKNSREGDFSSDMSEDEIMIIFKFIIDKDAFETHYRKLLAKRLIYGTSLSLDVEENVISRLQKENSHEYTSKLTKMFQDIKASNDLQESFKHYAQSLPNSDQIVNDFNIFVLAETMWPFSAFKHNFEVPKQLKPTYLAFKQLYNEKHNGRQLKWIWNLCRGELKANIAKAGKPPFVLNMTLFQMSIILPFNDKDSYTFAELMDITQLPAEQITGNIIPLIKYKLLNPSPSDPNKLGDPNTKFTVVKEYRSKKTRVNFATNIKIEQRQELEETNKEVQQSREVFLQACIVRIMKARKHLSHVMLINEVISQSHSRFKAQVSDIKKAIDGLIEREYLRRDGTDAYEYLA